MPDPWTNVAGCFVGAALNPTTAEKHLAYQLRVQVETMGRRGIRFWAVTVRY